MHQAICDKCGKVADGYQHVKIDYILSASIDFDLCSDCLEIFDAIMNEFESAFIHSAKINRNQLIEYAIGPNRMKS